MAERKFGSWIDNRFLGKRAGRSEAITLGHLGRYFCKFLPSRMTQHLQANAAPKAVMELDRETAQSMNGARKKRRGGGVTPWASWDTSRFLSGSLLSAFLFLHTQTDLAPVTNGNFSGFYAATPMSIRHETRFTNTKQNDLHIFIGFFHLFDLPCLMISVIHRHERPSLCKLKTNPCVRWSALTLNFN